MTTETINGLHSCKPGNEPQIGQVKLFVVQHMTSKKGKPYLKIKSANAENGGTPYRILQAEKTDFVDQHGNVSFNMEVEATSAPPTQFAAARATMQQGEPRMPRGDDEQDWPEAPENHPQSPPPRSNGEDGVTEARRHLMQSCNLLNLCIAAVNKAVAPNVPEIAQTAEFFQAQVATLFIEASREVWWSGQIVKPSYLSKMPATPIKNGDQ